MHMSLILRLFSWRWHIEFVFIYCFFILRSIIFTNRKTIINAAHFWVIVVRFRLITIIITITLIMIILTAKMTLLHQMHPLILLIFGNQIIWQVYLYLCNLILILTLYWFIFLILSFLLNVIVFITTTSIHLNASFIILIPINSISLFMLIIFVIIRSVYSVAFLVF